MTLKRGILLLILSLLIIVPTAAQESNVPETISLALQDLSNLLGTTITLNDITRFQWEGNVYSDASLGCPQEGETYAQVTTDGTQFLIVYDNIVYDYRVSEDGAIVVLCSQSDAPIDQPLAGPTATLLPPDTTETDVCPAVITVETGDTLFEIAQACNTTVGALVDANADIANRDDLIIPGQDLIIPALEEGLTDGITRDLAPLVAVYPLDIASSAQVILIGNALPPNTDVSIGFGPVASEYSILQEDLTTDENGSLYVEVDIPDIVDTDTEWVLVIVLPNNQEVVSATLTAE